MSDIMSDKTELAQPHPVSILSQFRLILHTLQHGRSQFPPFRKRQSMAVGGEHLDANVVGAGGVMLANAVSDRTKITPSDDRVDQPLTPAIAKIIFVESQP